MNLYLDFICYFCFVIGIVHKISLFVVITLIVVIGNAMFWFGWKGRSGKDNSEDSKTISTISSITTSSYDESFDG